MNPLDIKELLQHIFKFVPRTVIMSCVLTCKYFQNNVLIDCDQESVAKNGDMYSLHKINYSPLAVSLIAIKYDNTQMVSYLMDKYPEIINSKLCSYIGYNKNEYLMKKLNEQQFLYAEKGICIGSHFDLIDKYDLYNKHEFLVVFGIYKTNNKLLQAVLKRKFISELMFEYAKEIGNIYNKNENEVIEYLGKIFKDEPMYSLKYDNTYVILIDMEYYEVIRWLNKEIIKDMRLQKGYENILLELIENGKAELFFDIMSSKFIGTENRIKHNKYFDECYTNYKTLALWCIDFKRINMLTFLINKIIFTPEQYDVMLIKAHDLKFDDIKTLLINNISLFE